jgi:hypothetical protein
LYFLKIDLIIRIHEFLKPFSGEATEASGFLKTDFIGFEQSFLLIFCIPNGVKLIKRHIIISPLKKITVQDIPQFYSLRGEKE